jgi:16S rRNA (guanine(527)-N(7))-methyltransferase RsmG
VNSADELKQLMKRCGFLLNSEITDQMLTYLKLLEKWNARINLTSSTEWAEVRHLFQEGIWASRRYPDGPTAHLDIGSGAGFPGILLRILRPDMQLDMVESRGKRCVFLETVIDSLKMGGAKVNCMRLKEYLESSDKVWDCVTWKALKLSSQDTRELILHSHQLTQFWMFHGKQLAVEEPKLMERDFKLIQSEELESRRSWLLSIYLPRKAFHVKQFPAKSGF